jgi:hypothetical protein
LSESKPELEKYRDEIQEAEREERRQKSKLPERRPKQTGMKQSSGTQKSLEQKIFGKELKNVPTTLEQAMAIERESQSSNEVLGVLVEAQIKEADAILGRTFLRREDVAAVTDTLELARKGIGGVFTKPMPWLAEWVVDKLRALPSIDGMSRKQFVEAWRDSMAERGRQENRKNQEKNQGFQ